MKEKVSFLKRLDQYLLTHKPSIWSSRIHYVLFYGIGFGLIVSLISFLSAIDSRISSDIDSWVILLSVVSVLAFVVWLIFLLRFNVFKRYGKWTRFDSLKTFLLYFSIIALLISWPVLPLVFQSARADMAYSTDELVNDINDINSKICLLERETVDMSFKTDTLQLSDSVKDIEQRMQKDEHGYARYSEHYYWIDSATLRIRLQQADSVLKIRDSIFVTYICPNYQFVSVYDLPDTARDQLLSSFRLFNMTLKNKTPFDVIKTNAELESLLRKYTPPGSPTKYGIDQPSTYEQIIQKKYGLYAVSRSLSNIIDRKYLWDRGFSSFIFRLIYYLSLFLALLVFIYRHTTRKTFFLTLLCAVIIPVLTSLIIMAGNGGDYSLGWVLFYFLAFAVASLTILSAATRSSVAGIALNLAVLLVPLVPLLIVGLIYINLHNRPAYTSDGSEVDLYFKDYPNESLHYLLAEIAGAVLLVILFVTIIQKLYRRWYALPEE